MKWMSEGFTAAIHDLTDRVRRLGQRWQRTFDAMIDGVALVDTDGSESHTEPSTARLRARRSGEKALAFQLDRRIRAFLEGTDER